jgi:hypothetical protein
VLGCNDDGSLLGGLSRASAEGELSSNNRFRSTDCKSYFFLSSYVHAMAQHNLDALVNTLVPHARTDSSLCRDLAEHCQEILNRSHSQPLCLVTRQRLMYHSASTVTSDTVMAKIWATSLTS